MAAISPTVELHNLVRSDNRIFIEVAIYALVELGCNINDCEHEDGNTPLIAAVMNDDIEIVNILLFHGADVMAENSEGLNVFDVINFLENETGEQFSQRMTELLTSAMNAKNATN